ncbi:hypothetical protein ABZ816_22035 [Actinosynnema sp. NPDC047251]|uniref:Uncharacterized protein n=1 Tax=Saccharothrix espanaensis (strain ATCC 51144 / DSM 44229 / JCM 9112 / NBRC 15066 / NRRL 15764) TaxID=1179773 RepID=K0K0E7_SACES|nr:hypothetical protein [Saccharothrix espanaensis]CCH33715.1 hypothetical protein BN6_64720 [Saccharothrix espanaensis DSM 44229]
MTTPAPWPIVSRDKLVRAYHHGSEAGGEAPFRTLRRQKCVTAGVAVPQRRGGRLGGQVRFFSRLNVMAASLVRRGLLDEARMVATRALELEDSEPFRALRDLLASRPTEEVRAIIAGRRPAAESQAVIVEAAIATGRAEELLKPSFAEKELARMLAGHVTSVSDHVVLISDPSGIDTVVPRWLADGALRAEVGDPVIVRTVQLSGDQAMVEVTPGIDLEPVPYSPFDRADHRTAAITPADLDRIAGPAPTLHIPVPVVIGGQSVGD